MGMTIVDNFLPEEDYLKMQDYFFSSRVDWYAGNITPPKTDEKDDHLNNLQFVHSFYSTAEFSHPSPHLKALLPVLDRIPIYQILRIKMNLNPRTETPWVSGFHTDTEGLDNLTSIFYLNTCNGATVFEESGEEYESIGNRLITFPAKMRHASKTTTNAHARCVLNINYFATLS